MGFYKAVLADHRDGAAKLEAVSKAPSVDRDARVRALIMAKCCSKEVQAENRYDEENILDAHRRRYMQKKC